MVILINNELTLQSGVTLVSVDWQLSRNLSFTSIAEQSFNDTENLTSIIFDFNAIVGVTYYARSRALTSSGYTEWSNVDVSTSIDASVVNRTELWPVNISTPRPSTNYLKDTHPSSSFYITSTDYSSDGSAKHTKSHWVIRDLNGDVVWNSYNDMDNLTSIFVTTKLEGNKFYTISVAHVSSSGDTSGYGSVPIYVPRDERIGVYYQIGDVNINTPPTLDIQVNGINGITIEALKWRLEYEPSYNVLTKVLERSTWLTGSSISLDKQYLSPNKRYVLSLWAKIGGLESKMVNTFITFTDRPLDRPLLVDTYDEPAGGLKTLQVNLPTNLN